MAEDPQTSKPGLALCNVIKRYAEHLALDGLSLEVPPGETLALVGPSGCGKTTALRLFNGLIDPDAGQVLVDGKSLQHKDVIEHRRNTGYVIQDVGLLPHWTVARNVATTLALVGTPRHKVAARVAELLAAVGLTAEDGQRMPSQLSGGQRQRVGIARALAARPRFLLMDEPFGALDPLNRVRLRRLVNDLKRTRSLTAVLVTHDLEDARALADRVCIMRRGKLVETLSSTALDGAEDPWVQEFLRPDKGRAQRSMASKIHSG